MKDTLAHALTKYNDALQTKKMQSQIIKHNKAGLDPMAVAQKLRSLQTDVDFWRTEASRLNSY